jgi:hypothetical protein
VSDAGLGGGEANSVWSNQYKEDSWRRKKGLCTGVASNRPVQILELCRIVECMFVPSALLSVRRPFRLTDLSDHSSLTSVKSMAAAKGIFTT